MNTCFQLFGLRTKEWNSGCYANLTLNFLRSRQAVFHRDCTILHSHQPCMRVPISPCTCFLFFFFFIAILVGVKWYVSQRVFKKHFGLKDVWQFHPLVHSPSAFCSRCLQGHKNSWRVCDIYHVLGAVLSSSLATAQFQSAEARDFISNPNSYA